MRICLFTEMYYKGGVDTFLANLMNAWPAPDEFTLVCNRSHAGLDTLRAKVPKSVRVLTFEYLFTLPSMTGTSQHPFSRNIFFRALRRGLYLLLQYPVLFPWYVFSLILFFRHHSFDRLMVVNGGYPASLICRAASVAWAMAGLRPLAIHNFHSAVQPIPMFRRLPENFIDYLVLRATSQFISVSEACLSTLRVRPVFKGKIPKQCIPNGIVDPQTSHSDSPSVPAPKGDYVLMLATYEQHKGHEFLLRSFQRVAKEISPVQLHMFGHGTLKDRDRILATIANLALSERAFLHGFTSNTHSLLRQAKILVIPSQAYESFGLTAVEAMAQGVPIIATKVGGLPEVIQDGVTGILCSHDDVGGFAAAIAELLKNQAKAKKLTENGRLMFLEKYLAKEMANRYQTALCAGSSDLRKSDLLDQASMPSHHSFPR